MDKHSHDDNIKLVITCPTTSSTTSSTPAPAPTPAPTPTPSAACNHNVTHHNNLSDEDLSAISELIQNETDNTLSFDNKGIITGITLLASGLALTSVSISLAYPSKFKHRKLTKKIFSMVAIPLTTSGVILTTYFALHKNKTINE
jgi:hypothetical protein